MKMNKEDWTDVWKFTKILVLASAILVCIISLTSCTKADGSDDLFESYENTPYKDLIENHKVIVIDGCEYIIYDYNRGYGGYGYMTHKGNCTNPIHGYFPGVSKITIVRDSTKKGVDVTYHSK